MDPEEEDIFEDVEEQEDPEYSFTNSFPEERLQKEYKDFHRPAADLEKYRAADHDLYLMGIDITYTNRQTKDKLGIFNITQVEMS